MLVRRTTLVAPSPSGARAARNLGRVSLSSPTIRRRRTEDVEALCTLLAEQQPSSRYPFRWPPPYPVSDFIVRKRERAAWVAESEAGLLGHVAVLDGAGSEHGRTVEALTGVPPQGQGVVAVLFVALRARRRGVGRLLLEVAVEHCRAEGLRPVLDVVPAHEAAVALYSEAGWQVLSHVRAAWMPEHAPDLLLMTLPAVPPVSAEPAPSRPAEQSRSV